MRSELPQHLFQLQPLRVLQPLPQLPLQLQLPNLSLSQMLTRQVARKMEIVLQPANATSTSFLKVLFFSTNTMKVEINPTITMDNMRTISTLVIPLKFQTSVMRIGLGWDIIARSFLKTITVVHPL